MVELHLVNTTIVSYSKTNNIFEALFNDDFPYLGSFEFINNINGDFLKQVKTSVNQQKGGGYIFKLLSGFKVKNEMLHISLNTEGTYKAKLLCNTPQNLDTNITLKCSKKDENDQNSKFNHKLICGTNYFLPNWNGSLSARLYFSRLLAGNKDVFIPSQVNLGFVYSWEKQIHLGMEGILSPESKRFKQLTTNFQYHVQNSNPIILSSGITFKAEHKDINLRASGYFEHPNFKLGAKLNWEDSKLLWGAVVAKNFSFGTGKITLTSNPEIGISYSTKLSPNSKIIVSTQVPLNSLKHKTGFYLEVDV